ncbi:MAG: TIGR04283 family arsenosugar biosynthesis glycosyltransferase [Ginsengibacter sp.]
MNPGINDTLAGVSIIIPTYNEANYIGRLLIYLQTYATGNIQVIVADGGSTDETVSIAKLHGAIVVKCDQKGRAAQMNCGAASATRAFLYFVHADCLPPKNFFQQISCALQKGFSLGRFQTKFDSKSLLLKVNAFCTRFDWSICSGGDQTLFITRDAFQQLNGFNSKMLLMEDYEIVKRARKQYDYIIMKEKVLVSARKYHQNSWLKVQQAHRKIIKMYNDGVSQEALAAKYDELLNYRN